MDMQTNASKVVEMDRKIKKLQESFDALKKELMRQMLEQNVSQIAIKQQEVTLCTRRNKDFGAEINARELELKGDKAKLDKMGMFTISSTTNYIQVR